MHAKFKLKYYLANHSLNNHMSLWKTFNKCESLSNGKNTRSINLTEKNSRRKRNTQIMNASFKFWEPDTVTFFE